LNKPVIEQLFATYNYFSTKIPLERCPDTSLVRLKNYCSDFRHPEIHQLFVVPEYPQPEEHPLVARTGSNSMKRMAVGN
jgi:hypothetical protein